MVYLLILDVAMGTKAVVVMKAEDVLQCGERVCSEADVLPSSAMLCESNEIIAWIDCTSRHLACRL